MGSDQDALALAADAALKAQQGATSAGQALPNNGSPVPNYDPNQDVIGMGLWMQNMGKPIAPNPAQSYTDPTAATGPVPSYIPFGTQDGQQFSQQSPWTQETFKAQYGDQAEVRWSQQHNEEIKGTRMTYGANTRAGTYNPTPANIPVRQYAPLASGSIVPGQNITPQGSVPYQPPKPVSVAGPATTSANPTAPQGIQSTTGPNGQPIKDTDYVTLQDTRSGETLQLTEADWKAQQRDFPWITGVLRVVSVSPVQSLLLPAAPVGTVSQRTTPVVPQQVSTIKPPMAPGTVVGQAGAGLPTTTVIPGQIPTTLGPASSNPPPTAGEPGGPPLTPGPVLGGPYVPPEQRPAEPPARGNIPLQPDTPETNSLGQNPYTYDDTGTVNWMSPGEYRNLRPEVQAHWSLVPHPNQRRDLSSEGDQFGNGAGLKPQPDRFITSYNPVTGQTGEDPRTVTNVPQSQQIQTITAEARPVETLAQMSVQRQGGSVADTRTESTRILNGIGGLMRGDKSSAWAEPYLNDVARMAWAKENRDSGTNVDPRQAPLDYVEKWKDAFYGSDPSVPFVKDLDQQMIDNAVEYTHGNQAFDWKQAFGPNGESGLISRQIASNDCGTNTFASLLRSRGYNLDPATALAYGQRMGYHDGEQFRGPQAMVSMLRNEAGLDAQARPVDWHSIDTELDAGRPVGLSSGGHWWTVASYRDTPQGRQYYTGATGAVVGNPQWARPDEIQYGGSPNTMVTVHGDVDPNARGITALNLRPPGSQGTRANLSVQTNAAMNPQQPQAPQTGRANMSYADDQAAVAVYDSQIIKYSQQNGVDPDLTRAVMGQESQGSAGATSGVGAKGLMQLMPDTARGLGVTDITDPDQNISGGSRYLAQLIQQFGDIDTALAAYNAGPGNVMKYGLAGVMSPDFANGQTLHYVNDVKARYAALKQSQASQNSRYGTTR